MDDISASDRVVRNTAPNVNDRLTNELRGRLEHYRQPSEQIEARLSELNESGTKSGYSRPMHRPSHSPASH